jgi:hypothetical protein
MPRGPNGERRPADTVANAIHVAKIATGEVEDEMPSARRNGGLVGGKARRDALTPERRSEIAWKAATARWE